MCPPCICQISPRPVLPGCRDGRRQEIDQVLSLDAPRGPRVGVEGEGCKPVRAERVSDRLCKGRVGFDDDGETLVGHR